MDESGWDRVFRRVTELSRNRITPACRRALRDYADGEDGEPSALASEKALVEHLAEVAPLVCAGVSSVFKHAKHRPPRQAHYTPPDKYFTEEEELRAEALSILLADEARNWPPALEFRRRFLAGSTLGDGDADRFLRSPANGLLSPEHLAQAGIPTDGRKMITTEVSPEPRFEHLRTANGTFVHIVWLGVRCEWTEGDHQCQREETVPVATTKASPKIPWQIRKYQLSHGYQIELKFLPGSLLAELDRIAEATAFQFHWDLPATTWFMLTGQTPRTLPVMVGHTHTSAADIVHGRVSLEIHPWISKESVEKVFQHAQNWMLGKRVRHIESESLEKLLFVEWLRRTDAADAMTWSEIGKAWEAKHPQDSRRGLGDRRGQQFQWAIDRTRKELLQPIYAMGEDLAKLERMAVIRRALRLLPLNSRGREGDRLLAELRALSGVAPVTERSAARPNPLKLPRSGRKDLSASRASARPKGTRRAKPRQT